MYEWGGGGGGGLSRERLLPRSVVVTAKWVVSSTRITCIQPLSRCSLTFPASSFFSESVCLLLLFCFISLLFHHTSFIFIFGLLTNSYPLLACLIIAAILNFSFRLHLFTSRCYISSVVLIGNLLYQSAGPVFLDGGRVSDGLVMVSLAFHLFVVGTVIFASVLLCQVKSCQELLYSFKGKCGVTHKATKTGYMYV